MRGASAPYYGDCGVTWCPGDASDAEVYGDTYLVHAGACHSLKYVSRVSSFAPTALEHVKSAAEPRAMREDEKVRRLLNGSWPMTACRDASILVPWKALHSQQSYSLVDSEPPYAGRV